METNKRNDETEIDLKELFFVLLDKWLIILLCGLIGALGAFGYTKFMVTPVYQSTTAIYMINKQDTSSVTYSDLQLSAVLTKDYIELSKDRTVLEQVIQELDLPMSYEQLRGLVSVTSAEETRVIYISVRHPDPYQAMAITEKVQEVAAKHIMEVTNTEAVNVAVKANLPTSPIGYNTKRNTVMGGLIGIILVAGIVIVQYLLNDKIGSPDDIEHYLGLSTLGSIPLDEEQDKSSRKKQKKRASTAV